MQATIELLPFFLAVAEAGTFTAAAASLGQTKSRVSRAVAQLEAELDTELFHRTTRAVALTTAGVALFERASPLVLALRDAVGSLPERQELPSGDLRVTAPADIGGILADVVARYTLRWPDVRVEVHLTNRLVDLVREGFDLGLRASTGTLADTSLVARRVGQVDAFLFASPSYLARRGTPRDTDDATHDWIAFIPASRTQPLSRHVAPRIRCDNLLFVRELLRAGAGIGWLPHFLADPLVASGELALVLPSWRFKGASWHVIYPSRRRVPIKVTAFRDLLVEALKLF